MVIFIAEGRLGNQIFQYAFIKTIKNENEKILSSGLNELLEVFEVDDVTNLRRKKKRWRLSLFRLIKPTLNILSDMKIISSISVNHDKVLNTYERESATYDSRQGLIKNITFIKRGFFQSEAFFDKNTADQLQIKNKYKTDAAKLLKDIPRDYHKIFVHVRIGDYKHFKIYGKDTLLPFSYFEKQIDWFTKNKNNCFFIFLSDEPDIIKDRFPHVKMKLISTNNHHGTDLAIMSKCNSAILSPSSFSWWGSYFMKKRDTVFAPKYWLGFNSKIEFQGQGTPSYSKKIKI